MISERFHKRWGTNVFALEFSETVRIFISQMELAKALRVPVQRVNTVINGKRGVSAETALLLARRLNTTPEFWMNLQTAWDRYEAAQGLRRASA